MNEDITRIAQEAKIQEKKEFEEYLKNRHYNIEIVKEDIGEEYLEKLIEELALMRLQIGYAKEAARKKDMQDMVQLLGAGARRTKDGIYGTLMMAKGGVELNEDGITMRITSLKAIEPVGLTAIIRDYVMKKYEDGERTAIFIYQN